MKDIKESLDKLIEYARCGLNHNYNPETRKDKHDEFENIVESLRLYHQKEEVDLDRLIEEFEKNLDIIHTCLEDAPVDFLGTGGIGSKPEKDHKEWYDKWSNSYEKIINLVKNLQQPTKSDAVEFAEWIEENATFDHDKGYLYDSFYHTIHELYELFQTTKTK